MSVHSSRGTAWQAVRLSVLERDGYRCGYCGGVADTVDHIKAKANGGTDDAFNLISACAPCNAKKGSKTLIRNSGRNERWYSA